MSGVPPSTDNYNVPAGQKIAINDGTGEVDLGNIAGLDIEHTIEVLEHWSNRSGMSRLDKTKSVSRKIEFPFILDEPVAENLQKYFCGGTISTNTPGTSPITDESLVLTGVVWSSLDHAAVSSVVVTNLGGGTTYTEDSDYVVDYQAGRIRRTPTSTITTGQTVLVDYSYATYDSKQFAISGADYFEGSARIEIFPGTELGGIRKEFVIHKCQIKPNGTINLNDKEWEKIPMILTVLDDFANHPTEPYGHLLVYED